MVTSPFPWLSAIQYELKPANLHHGECPNPVAQAGIRGINLWIVWVNRLEIFWLACNDAQTRRKSGTRLVRKGPMAFFSPKSIFPQFRCNSRQYSGDAEVDESDSVTNWPIL
ncbi:MAG TPA: hypothetical protein VJM34_16450 [Novosphingobium sp.]|nr:hypothetical protein [Novosphingobium sp.]